MNVLKLLELNKDVMKVFLMLFTPTGTFYSKVQFKTEEEVEKVVVKNFKLLFGRLFHLATKKFNSDF